MGNAEAEDESQVLIQLNQQLQKDKDLSQFSFEEDFILKFLRCKDFDVNSTFKLIKNYVWAINAYPQIFGDLDRLKVVFEANFYTCLDGRGRNKELITILRCGSWNPYKVDFYLTLGASAAVQELKLLEETVQENGIIEIIDVSNVSPRIYLNMSIWKAKVLVQMKETVLPIKWKKIFIVNQSRFADIFYKMIHPFLSEELKQRVTFVGGDVNKIHEFVPPEILPPEYGGTATDVHAINTYKHLMTEKETLHTLWESFKKANPRS